MSAFVRVDRYRCAAALRADRRTDVGHGATHVAAIKADGGFVTASHMVPIDRKIEDSRIDERTVRGHAHVRICAGIEEFGSMSIKHGERVTTHRRCREPEGDA